MVDMHKKKKRLAKTSTNNTEEPRFTINAIFEIIYGAFHLKEDDKPKLVPINIRQIIQNRYSPDAHARICQSAVISLHEGKYVQTGVHLNQLVELAQSGDNDAENALNKFYVHMTDNIEFFDRQADQLSEHAEKIFILPPVRCAAFTYATARFGNIEATSKKSLPALKVFFSLMKYYLTAYKEEDLSTKVKFRNIDRDSIFRSIVFTYKQLLKDYPNLNMPFSLINNLATITYRAGCMTNDTELMKESCFFLNLGLNKCHNPTEQEIGVFNLYKMLKMVRFFPSSLYEQTCVNYKTLRLDNDLKVETISENNFRIRAQYLDKEVNIQFYVDLILTKDLIPKFLIHKI